MAVKYLMCGNCRQVIARFDPAKIDSPLRGEMFESHLADRGVAPPFGHGLEARWFKCPMCPMRPWAEPEPHILWVSDTIDGQNPYQVQTAAPPPPLEPPSTQGPSPVDDFPGEEGFICELCGRSLKSAQGLASHKRACQGGTP